MFYRGDKIITFDIETTGLSPIQDKFICASFYDKETDEVVTIRELEETPQFEDAMFVTYNGGNGFNRGFDFPFVRYICLEKNINYPFSGIKHLDLYPLVSKYLNLFKIIEEPIAISNLYKHDLEKIAMANEIEYTNKKDTYKKLNNLQGTNWLDYKEESKESCNSEQDVYQLLFDKDKKEEYISGKEVPTLYRQGKIDDIIRHNRNDVKRLYQITEATWNIFPDEAIRREIHIL